MAARVCVCISPLWRHKNKLSLLPSLARAHTRHEMSKIDLFLQHTIFHLMTSANTPAAAFPESVWITVIIFIVHALVQGHRIGTQHTRHTKVKRKWMRQMPKNKTRKEPRDEKLMDDGSCFVQLCLLFLTFYLLFQTKWHLHGSQNFVIFVERICGSLTARLESALTSSITILSSFRLIVCKLMEVIQMAPAPSHVWANARELRKHWRWLLHTHPSLISMPLLMLEFILILSVFNTIQGSLTESLLSVKLSY